jgi:hypothetical protein
VLFGPGPGGVPLLFIQLLEIRLVYRWFLQITLPLFKTDDE